MNRRAFLRILPGLWVTLRVLPAGAAELATAHLRIDGMT